jgi:hypothetical protein
MEFGHLGNVDYRPTFVPEIVSEFSLILSHRRDNIALFASSSQIAKTLTTKNHNAKILDSTYNPIIHLVKNNCHPYQHRQWLIKPSMTECIIYY